MTTEEALEDFTIFIEKIKNNKKEQKPQ